MRVSIVPGTKQEGLIFKKEMHTITFSAAMSEEEKAKVKHARIEKESVIEVPLRPDISAELHVEDFMEGKEWMCEMFFEFGADLYALDYWNYSPLERAIQEGNPQIVK